jgi:hypothetical protein
MNAQTGVSRCLCCGDPPNMPKTTTITGLARAKGGATRSNALLAKAAAGTNFLCT